MHRINAGDGRRLGPNNPQPTATYHLDLKATSMLQGKTALVTGSTSGIGLGIALALAKQGANIMLNGFGDHDTPMQQVQALGVKVGYHGADMSQPHQIAEMIDHGQSFGGIDILVNNAGIQHVAPIEQFPVDKWDAVIAINLSSAFHSIRLALPLMRQRNWGRIINIASVQGMVGSIHKAAYVAAKHGVIGLTKVVALETATTGVTCNAICPGWVLTPLVQKQIEDRAAKEGKPIEQAKRELLGERQPSMQFVTPEQLGELAVFLSSPAGDNVRGVAWNVDGGWVAQ